MRSTLTAAATAASFATPVLAEDPRSVQAFVILPVTAEAHDSFEKIMRDNIAGSRAEPGNISFDAFTAEDGSPGIFLVERWKDDAALQSHMATSHLQAVEAAVGTAVGAAPTQVWMSELAEIPAEPAAEAASPRNIVVMLDTDAANRPALIEALVRAVPPSRAAPGNLGYNVFAAADEPNRLIVVERWASADEHEAHRAADYSQRLNAALDGLLIADPMQSRWVLSEIPVAG